MFLFSEMFDSDADVIFNEVVAEDDADGMTISKIFGKTESFRDTGFHFFDKYNSCM